MGDRREIEREHAAVRNEIGVVRRLIEEAEPPSMLLQRLAALCDLLERHVTQEEIGRYLDELAARQPELQGTVAALHADHRALLDAVQRLRQQVAAAAALPLAALRVLEQVGRHELAENDLVRRAAAAPRDAD